MPPTRRASAWWSATAGALCLAHAAFAQTVVAPAYETSSLKKLSLDELLELEVTSVSRQPEKLSASASAIQVITGETIRRSSASSLPEALRLASNLHVARKGSRAWGISARGFNTELANKMLVMIDGRTVYTPLFSGVFWERQDYLLEDLDRIEVISGPGGTLWGANAVNGVINITSRSARDTPGAYLEGGFGDQLQSFAAGRYGGALSPAVHYRVYAKRFDRDAERRADGTSAVDGWNHAQAGFRVDAVGNANDAFTLQGDFYNGDHDVATGGSTDLSGGNLLGRWTRHLGTGGEIILQAYYDRTHLRMPVPAYVINGIPLAPAGELTDDLDTYDLDFQHRLEVAGRHQIVWGLGYRRTHDATDNAPALAFLPPDLSQNLFSGFAQDEFALADDLALTLGTKLEHTGYTGWEVEPGVRLQWNAATDHMLWAALSRAVRTPSRIDRDLAQPAPPNLVVLAGSANFQSENVIAGEFGYRGLLASRVIAAISAYWNEYDRVRSTGPTPETLLPFVFANDLTGETYGFEVSLDYPVTESWRLHLGYNHLQSRLRIAPGGTDINNALNETADPENQLALRSSWDLPHNFELDAAARWVDSFTINNGGVAATVDSYAELDVRLGWRITESVTLSIVGQNLLHDRHAEYGAPLPAQTGIERTIFGKVACRF